jgi:hypothetical protein
VERKIESGRNGVLSGAELAQSHVIGWVENDRPMVERVRRIMSGEEMYRLDLPVSERVRMFIAHIVYGDDGSTYRTMYRAVYGHLGGFESHVPGLVRDSFTRADFDGIDWDAVVSDLKEEA